MICRIGSIDFYDWIHLKELRISMKFPWGRKLGAFTVHLHSKLYYQVFQRMLLLFLSPVKYSIVSIFSIDIAIHIASWHSTSSQQESSWSHGALCFDSKNLNTNERGLSVRLIIGVTQVLILIRRFSEIHRQSHGTRSAHLASQDDPRKPRRGREGILREDRQAATQAPRGPHRASGRLAQEKQG